ncbi:MAG TPA: GNVR domain-containing protein [Bryobacteraceae bacterium]|nr:GNVR domain-containing protein [Bryobacteraceae bacterium]
MPELEEEDDFSQTLDRIWSMFIRRRWIVIGIGCTIALATIAVTFRIPNEYTSEATILVDAQKVSERYVVSTTTSNVSQALEAMEHEVLSRPKLLGIIEELNLYRKQRKTLAPEQLIALMRENLSIEPFARPGQIVANAFRISFTSASPELAQQVASRLSTLFIEQNLKTRSEQATTTTTFLHEQLENTKNELTSQENQLRDFKMQYLGELPEQQQSNVAILRGLENQLTDVTLSRNQAKQQRLYLESQLNEHRRRELSRLQTERRQLLTSFTPQHPDVVKKDQEITRQQKLVESLSVGESLTSPQKDQTTASTSTSGDDLEIVQLTRQLQANAFEIDALLKKEQKFRAEVDQYRSRLNQTPIREQQVTAMQRDYDLLRQHYGDLLKKEQESQLATNLEKRQEGQQFRLADPPNLPTRPSAPKRVKIALGALAVGLVLGCAFAVLAEVKNRSFHTEDEVSSLVLPMVIGVPRFFTPGEQRQRARKRALEWCAGLVLLFAVVAAEYFVYRHG